MSNVQQTTRTRKPRATAPDVCHLTITVKGTDYRCRILTPDPRGGVRQLVRLRKVGGTGDAAVYHVARHRNGQVSCECPDHIFRCEGTSKLCKHARSLVALRIIDAPTPPSNDEWAAYDAWTWNPSDDSPDNIAATASDDRWAAQQAAFRRAVAVATDGEGFKDVESLMDSALVLEAVEDAIAGGILDDE
jgi:hypothetical protein